MIIKIDFLRLIAGATILICSNYASATSYTFSVFNAPFIYGINNSGQMVGWDSGAAVWSSNGTIEQLLQGQGSTAYGINNVGQVVGGSHLDLPEAHATIWNNFLPTDLGIGIAYGVNNPGQVVGVSAGGATIWNNGIATYLGTLGGTSGVAYGINDVGQAVGSAYKTGDTVSHAVVWNNGVVSDLGTLDGAVLEGITLAFSNSVANGINDAGTVVGQADFGFDIWSNRATHAMAWNQGKGTDLGTLGGSSSFARGINRSGQVIGNAQTVGDISHAALWNGSTITDLNSFLDASAVNSGWVLYSATAISENGSITGVADNTITGERLSYVLSVTLVPEPETYAMLFAGLGLVGGAVRRRKLSTLAVAVP